MTKVMDVQRELDFALQLFILMNQFPQEFKPDQEVYKQLSPTMEKILLF